MSNKHCRVFFFLLLTLDTWTFLGSAEDYRLPFTEYLETDEEPTFNEMREVVVEQRKQLQLPERYENDEVILAFFAGWKVVQHFGPTFSNISANITQHFLQHWRTYFNRHCLKFDSILSSISANVIWDFIQHCPACQATLSNFLADIVQHFL